jgi:hypothetical protein
MSGLSSLNPSSQLMREAKDDHPFTPQNLSILAEVNNRIVEVSKERAELVKQRARWEAKAKSVLITEPDRRVEDQNGDWIKIMAKKSPGQLNKGTIQKALSTYVAEVGTVNPEDASEWGLRAAKYIMKNVPRPVTEVVCMSKPGKKGPKRKRSDRELIEATKVHVRSVLESKKVHKPMPEKPQPIEQKEEIVPEEEEQPHADEAED